MNQHYQMKWINKGIKYETHELSWATAKEWERLMMDKTLAHGSFYWIEPMFPEPGVELEWEDVMGKGPCLMAQAKDMSILVDLLGDQFADDYMSVEMVATGYEFWCRECDEYTKIPEWTQIVQCNWCCTTFRANDPEHVYE